MQAIESKLAQFLENFEREKASATTVSANAEVNTFAESNTVSFSSIAAAIEKAQAVEEKPFEVKSVEVKMVEAKPFEAKPFEAKKVEPSQQQPHAEKTMTAWERRKLEILAEYGMPAESETVNAVPTENVRSTENQKVVEEVKEQEVVTESVATDVTETSTSMPYHGADRRKTPRPLTSIKDEALEALHSTIENINISDCEEIAELKKSLTAKLREAEIELSINRAKLSQQWAALERRQFEINQKESMLKCKYGYVDEDSDVKPRLLDRISRHLSRKSNRTDRS